MTAPPTHPLHGGSGGVGGLTATLALVVVAGHAAVAHLVYFDARSRGADRPERWAVRYVVLPVVLPYYLRVRGRIGERTVPVSPRERLAGGVALAGLVAAGVAVGHHPRTLTGDPMVGATAVVGPFVVVYLLAVGILRLRGDRDQSES